MIRLPKATKTPVKSKLVPRQSLATIVKDLGKNTSRDLMSHWPVLHCDLLLSSVVVVSLQPSQLL